MAEVSEIKRRFGEQVGPLSQIILYKYIWCFSVYKAFHEDYWIQTV